ncbi:flagellar basal-body rod protein FlgF [Vulcanibacillus modesticaldus]|uniref:Flagellar basal-body rod protein FlgF n=1 Tax=Vulcanibacillus modesticaldus TaxID=337097 RepID=A0A1D2YXK6_9BACI|nr:flagellar basal body rod protein FlgG [Vulcanibacillus modesticaldus]OEG00408.1 flagellar basal-body rod protein FlgF [Vulcanibacillus modesticaldus]
MLRSMYSGIAGMRGFQTKLDVISNNVANVNTIGFKASRVLFQDILSQKISGVTAPEEGVRGGINPKLIGLGSSISSIDTIHTPGTFMTTNVPTDLAIEGDGFFAVAPNADGEEILLTRAGNFMRDAVGNLVTSQGYLVLGVGGEPINIPTEVVAFNISADGSIITTTADGETEVIGQLGLVKVQNPSGLEKVGNSFYKMTLNANPEGELEVVEPQNVEVGTGRILTGQLEMSNVDLTAELTEMIVAQRGFQANSRSITTSDEILQEVVNLKR